MPASLLILNCSVSGMTQLSSCKTWQHDRYLPGSGGWLGSAGLFWLCAAKLQADGGWVVRLQTGVESTCKLLHSCRVWAERIQLGWVHRSLSPSQQLLGVGRLLRHAQITQAVWPERACRAWHFNHPDVCGKLWEGSAILGRGIDLLKTGRVTRV